MQESGCGYTYEAYNIRTYKIFNTDSILDCSFGPHLRDKLNKNPLTIILRKRAWSASLLMTQVWESVCTGETWRSNMLLV